jgi:hypothetical protein
MRQVSEMNKGVQILLQRMESHPHEFVPDLHSEYPHKWRMLLRKVDNRVNHIKTKGVERKLEPGIYTPDLSFLQDDEIQALHAKVQSIRGDLFTKEVMNTLLVAEDTLRDAELSFSLEELNSERQKTVQLMQKIYAERAQEIAQEQECTNKYFEELKKKAVRR